MDLPFRFKDLRPLAGSLALLPTHRQLVRGAERAFDATVFEAQQRMIAEAHVVGTARQRELEGGGSGLRQFDLKRARGALCRQFESQVEGERAALRLGFVHEDAQAVGVEAESGDVADLSLRVFGVADAGKNGVVRLGRFAAEHDSRFGPVRDEVELRLQEDAVAFDPAFQMELAGSGRDIIRGTLAHFGQPVEIFLHLFGQDQGARHQVQQIARFVDNHDDGVGRQLEHVERFGGRGLFIDGWFGGKREHSPPAQRRGHDETPAQ